MARLHRKLSVLHPDLLVGAPLLRRSAADLFCCHGDLGVDDVAVGWWCHYADYVDGTTASYRCDRVGVRNGCDWEHPHELRCRWFRIPRCLYYGGERDSDLHDSWPGCRELVVLGDYQSDRCDHLRSQRAVGDRWALRGLLNPFGLGTYGVAASSGSVGSKPRLPWRLLSLYSFFSLRSELSGLILEAV